MKRPFVYLAALAISLGLAVATATESSTAANYDVVVFGGTPAGIAAAVAAGQGGAKVLLVEPSYLIGGLMSGGLTKTDIGKADTIGGLARDFYNRVLAHYTKTYGAESEQVKACDGGYYFEPKVALQIFGEQLTEARVAVRTKERLESVEVKSGQVRAITTRNYETGKESRLVAKVFVDGSYEGDVMAQAGVLYRVGREAREEYGESLAGLTEGPAEYLGKGDHRVQAYNIRGTITTNDQLRLPIPKPQNYYRVAHAGLIRTVNQHQLKSISELFPDVGRWAMINGKCDPNKADFPGANFGYTEGDYEQRARITAKVQDYWLSLWYLLQNDPELPEAFKADARRWGLPKDEFLESNHVTPQIYVRVARRMQGRYLLTQRDVQYDRFKPDTICMGSYNTDCHAIQVIQTDDGPRAEGSFNGAADAYEIPYRCLLPHGVNNLLVVAAVSATHVAYSSLRMEPVFMMLGHAGGIAAQMAAADGIAAQDISIQQLQSRLAAAGIPLQAPFRPVVEIRLKTALPLRVGEPVEFELVAKQERAPLTQLAWNFDGSGAIQATNRVVRHTFLQPTRATVLLLATDADKKVALPATLTLELGDVAPLDREVHYEAARLVGRWSRTRGPEVEYRQRVALVDDRKGDGAAQAYFTTTLSRTGRYRVAIACASGGNRATNVPVTITHADGTAQLKLDQRRKNTPFAFVPVGEFRFEAGNTSTVTISNQDANGHVTIDAVRWVWLGE